MTAEELQFPELSEPYALSDEQVEEFQEHGFIILKGVLSPREVSLYGEAIRRDGMRHFEAAGMQTVFSGSLLQKLNFRFESEAMRAYSLSRRLGSIGARLTRSKSVRIYHEQLLFKPPGGAPSFWHQDQYFWPLETTQSLGTWMPLLDITADMGAMRFVQGSHRLGDQGQHDIEQKSEDYFNTLIEAHGLKVVQVEAMQAGDMTVHNGWTIHGAAGNLSSAMRAAVVVSMYPDGTRVGPILNEYRASDRIQFLGSRNVGELADSDLNTLLYTG